MQHIEPNEQELSRREAPHEEGDERGSSLAQSRAPGETADPREKQFITEEKISAIERALEGPLSEPVKADLTERMWREREKGRET